MQDCSEAKKPCKGILKTSSSFDRPGASYRKSAKFDELNVLQTYHPLDKDYGHMKIDEPKTPYNYMNQGVEQGLDAELLAEKLRIAANTQTSFGDDDDFSDDELNETPDERVRRLEFEKRRKAHYNEYEAVKLARKLIEEELLDDDDEGDDDDNDRNGNEEENGNVESGVVSVGSEEIRTNSSERNYGNHPVGKEQTDTREPGNVATANDVDSASARSSAINVRPMDVDHDIPSNSATGGDRRQ